MSGPGGGDAVAPTFAIPILLPMAGYVGLGMSEGVVGVVWPELSREFALGDAGQSLLTASFAVGFIAAALPHGRLLRRFGTGRVLVAAAGLAMGGALALLGARSAAWIAAGSLLLGLSAGAMDSALSSHASLHYPHSRILKMHGGFGVGAFLGPLALTVFIRAGASWRWSYAILLAVELALLLAWARVRGRWHGEPVLAEHHDGEGAPARTDARRIVIVLGVVGFFFYTGTELSIGNWANTLLLDRGMEAGLAGLASSGYFGALMAGRLLLGFVDTRLPPLAVVTLATVAAAGGAVVLGFTGAGAVTLAAVALVVSGFCLAGVFPSLVALTPGRVGPGRAPSVMGVQLAAASAGAAILPGAIGVLSDVRGRPAIGPALFAVALLLVLAHLATTRAAGQHLLGRE